MMRDVDATRLKIKNAASNSRIGMTAATYTKRMMRDVDATRLEIEYAASNSTVRSAATRH